VKYTIDLVIIITLYIVTSVAMCTTPDELYNHEELLPPFLANQLAFCKDDHVMLQIQIEERFYSVAISYHSSTSERAKQPIEIDLLFVISCRF